MEEGGASISSQRLPSLSDSTLSADRSNLKISLKDFIVPDLLIKRELDEHGRNGSPTHYPVGPTLKQEVKIEHTAAKRKRASFFGSWEKYTEAENDEYCRLNNRAVSSDTKTIEIIDLDEYEKEQMKQQVRTKQRAKHAASIRKKQEHLRKFKCQFCYRSYQMEGTYRRHLITHFDCRNFSCEICQKPNRDVTAARIHLNSHSEVQCSHCTKKFCNPAQLNEHLKLEQPNISARYNCIFCCDTSLDLGDIESIEEHLAKHSRLENMNNDVEAIVRLKRSKVRPVKIEIASNHAPSS